MDWIFDVALPVFNLGLLAWFGWKNDKLVKENRKLARDLRLAKAHNHLMQTYWTPKRRRSDSDGGL